MPAHIIPLDPRSLKGDPSPISEADLYAVQERVKALDKLFKEQSKHLARYKIEIMFGDERSTWKPTPGVMSFWESGTKLHGGGDAKIYICPSSYLNKGTCTAVIPEISTGQGLLVCPGCNAAWKGDQVIGEIFGRWTMKVWADVILRYFILMSNNADIYLKFSPTDIRYKAALEQVRQRGGEELEKARRDRGKHIYPLRNLIKDTAAGADLWKRLHSFLVA